MMAYQNHDARALRRPGIDELREGALPLAELGLEYEQGGGRAEDADQANPHTAMRAELDLMVGLLRETVSARPAFPAIGLVG